jgi:hypothetical protein
MESLGEGGREGGFGRREGRPKRRERKRAAHAARMGKKEPRYAPVTFI